MNFKRMPGDFPELHQLYNSRGDGTFTRSPKYPNDVPPAHPSLLVRNVFLTPSTTLGMDNHESGRIAQGREMLGYALTRKDRVILGCAAYLFLIWLVACLPLLSVAFEYRGIVLCADLKQWPAATPESLGWLLATLYGAFFIFPLAVGGFAMIALVLPLATLVFLVRDKRAGPVLIAFYVHTTAAICFLEFYASPPALFQVAPEVIASRPAFLAGLSKAICPGSPTAFTDYRGQLAAMLSTGRSWTGFFCYPGVVALTLMQNALFVVFLGFIYFDRGEIKRKAPYLKDVIFYILGYAMFLGAIWCLFRLSYRNDTQILFNYSNPFYGDLAIIGTFLFALVVGVLYFQFQFDALAKTFTQIGQLITLVVGAAAVHFNWAGAFFGTRASVMNVVALALFFFFLKALVAAFLLRGRR
jgi:hypothetical protein